jgi:outer membrane protein insertion porin family
VESIVISGNDHVPEENITERMQTKKFHWWGEGEFKEALFAADRDTVLNAIRHFGYLDAELREYRADYLPDSTCGFYLGRVVPKDKKLTLLYAQLNEAIADTANPMHDLAGRTFEKSLHYYRNHRTNYPRTAQAIPVPVVGDEEKATAILNGIVTYENLRKEWLRQLRRSFGKILGLIHC